MSKNMLVAEDSAVLRKSIGITFAYSGYNLNFSENGADALSKAKELHPDIIIADAHIAGKNGYELCEAIKKDPQLSGTKVLLLSGAQQPYDENKGKSVGVDGYMIKPFETQALIKKVQELVENKSASISQITQTMRPQPSAPSPASTIAISSPYAQPSSPSQGISDAPFLDMDFSQAAIPEPDLGLSLDDATAGFPMLSDTTQPMPKDMKIPTAPAKEPVPAAEDDFWNFSSEPEPAAAPQNETSNWGVIEPTQIEPSSGDFNLELISPAESANMKSNQPESSEIDFGFTSSATELPNQELSSDFSDAFHSAPILDLETDVVPPSKPQPASASVSPTAPTIGSAAPFGTTAPISLSNEQIEAIVSRVFKEVIERIAWEVVPDMAENIIKEELSRLLKK